MKIKDCIIDSLERQDYEYCVKPVLPICFSEMMRSMSSICLCVANSLLEQRYQDVGDKQFGINAQTTENPGFDEFFQVLCGNDFWRSSILNAQIYGFFDWLLEQEKPCCDDDNSLWFGTRFLFKKWNEYAEMKGKGDG